MEIDWWVVIGWIFWNAQVGERLVLYPSIFLELCTLSSTKYGLIVDLKEGFAIAHKIVFSRILRQELLQKHITRLACPRRRCSIRWRRHSLRRPLSSTLRSNIITEILKVEINLLHQIHLQLRHLVVDLICLLSQLLAGHHECLFYLLEILFNLWNLQVILLYGLHLGIIGRDLTIIMLGLLVLWALVWHGWPVCRWCLQIHKLIPVFFSEFYESLKLRLYLNDHFFAFTFSLLNALDDGLVFNLAVILKAVELIEDLAGHLGYFWGLAQLNLILSITMIIFLWKNLELGHGNGEAILICVYAIWEAFDMVADLLMRVNTTFLHFKELVFDYTVLF